MDRRKFLHDTAWMSSMVGMGLPTWNLLNKPNITKLTILHTNDQHSRIEPFPMDGGRNQGKGGAAKRATIINRVREKEKNVLLLDAGDIFQGTPYFNFFGGELEMKLMSEMGYDAATIGNHDFDGGIDGLNKQLKHAKFPLIISNYDFSNTILNGKTLTHKVFKKGGIKIGVFGLGIELKGLVPIELYKETKYLDPIIKGDEMASMLKNDLKCDYVICLSHLGYKYNNDKVSDLVLAQNTSNIDLILGGHTHTFLDEPTRLSNKEGQPVLVNQAGWAGIVLGRIDVYFEKGKKDFCETCENILID